MEPGWTRLRACAVQYPDVEADFGPCLNSVLSARHCLVTQHGQGRTLNEARLQPYKDFDVETLGSATVDRELVHHWLTNQDGMVGLDLSGPVLKDVRPENSRLYLLQKDRYGILETRAQSGVSPNHASSGVVPSTLTEGLCAGYSFDAAIQLPPAQGAIHEHGDDADLQCDPVVRNALHLADSGDENFSPEGLQTANSAGHSERHPAKRTPSVVCKTAPKRSRNSHSGCSVPLNQSADVCQGQTEDHACDAGLGSGSHATNGSVRPVVSSSSAIGSALPPLLVSSLLIESVEKLTLEERLHSTHRMNIATYMDMLAATAAEGHRQTRAQWLTPNISWATIRALGETLGKVRARDEQEADVLYCTAADFILHARAGKLFTKPLVIKEHFADLGMHTIELFLTLLEESCSQYWLDVRRMNTKEAAPIRTDALADLARRPSCVEHGSTMPNLLNSTDAHRPVFTMLPRFRLLETLTE
ncbi:hypothetical protein LTR56_027857 [Elasticomyces elasticus]|nr:hypothetical protein LTR56_027857 [Elasticomyces elasticus]KAK3620180.1 hypothetical protein LTR22_025694 [Elasticomyces elasticus]KAK4905564.1 hypothetical protein LTR49_025162 [Elasticomyces elasticus]